MNGTMEEPTDTLLPDPLTNNKNSAVDSKPLQNDAGELSTGLTEIESGPDSPTSNGLNNEIGEKEALTVKSNNETSTVPIKENSNNGINNHCSNSNESYPESENSSQGNIENDKQDMSENKDLETVKIDDGDTHLVESGESSDDEDSVLLEEPKAEDAVSINSDSSSDDDNYSQDGQTNEIIILENDRPDSPNGTSRGSASPEVHDITSDNDDCILTSNDKSNCSTKEKEPLRRSSRTLKRKYFEDNNENGDESDVEEVELEDPLCKKSKPIGSDIKAFVEMAHKKNKQNKRKEPTIVVIDTHSGKSQTTQAKSTTTSSSVNAHSLYQSIVARGTTVTPVSSKISTACQSSPPSSQATILPSLTDDMFVVEAPSFIVPYVYEKPSVKPFREFVDKLGKELEEQKAREEEEEQERNKKEKERKEQLRKERKERGEDVSESEDETLKQQADEKKRKKAEKKAKCRRRNEDDDASWDGESSSETDDDNLSDEDSAEIKDKDNSIEEIKNVTSLSADKVSSAKSDSYFDCSLGKFFVNIGLSLVQEFVQSDLLKTQNRKLIREKKAGHNTRATQSAIASLMKNLEFSKENNAPYAFSQTKCELCSFKSESKLVMNHHLETPHMKNNMYKCNFCEFEIRSPHEILCHMDSVHKVKGRLERAPAYHQCCNCVFEDNGKGKLARHQIACAKKFKPELNLAPPIDWEPPAKIPKIARARNNMMGSFQNAFSRQVQASNLSVRTPLSLGGMKAVGSGVFQARGRSPMALAAARAPVHGVLPIVRGGAISRLNTPTHLPNFTAVNNGKPKAFNNLSISITPLPRQPQPATQPSSQVKNSFVICEICDGYIKDLEQLRNHMQWIHKVRIHPKMIYNRPPLNCQKCQFRFFTDQGLERHLLGSHGLVTSSMQEAANKGKDSGRCPVCGRVYQWKLLNHVSKDHNLTLKPAHLSYKCTVCTATFGMYKQFENHVYSAHSVVAKRVMDKSKTETPVPKTTNDTLLKPLKINDEITIIPQPTKAASSTKTK